MSATIRWEPVNEDPYSIPTGAPSSFWEKLTKCMNTRDDVVTLDRSDLGSLRALAIGAGSSEPYFERLVESVEKYGKIRVWREF
jgi:hypothetical protein